LEKILTLGVGKLRMSVADHYGALVDRSKKLLDKMVADDEAVVAFTKSHNFLADYQALHDAIAHRPEAKVFSLAIREYQFALYALSIGTYRHAFISLRLFFELGLATVYFSAFEIKLRKWLKSTEDIVWGALVDTDNGVYAHAFISAFEPELASSAKQYRVLAEKVYRECSEYVHGNMHTHAETLLDFDKSHFLSWHERADTVRLCILFPFAARFLTLSSKTDRDKLESIMVESLGHLPTIQALYNSQA
jgi:hypothetical protein